MPRPANSPFTTRRLLLVALAAAGIAAMGAPAMAVQPGHWTNDTEADFATGKTDGTVVTNLGDIKLSRDVQELAKLPESSSIIYDMVKTADGTIYTATGPDNGRILRRKNDKVEEVVSLTGEQIFKLAIDAKGRIIVAISGENTRLAVLNGNKLDTLVEIEGVRYIWDMILDGNTAYLATGTPARLLAVDLTKAADVQKKPRKDKKEADSKPAEVKPGDVKATDAKASDAKADAKAGDDAVPPLPENPAIKTLLAAPQANLLCLGRDKTGRLYAGSDTDGLVFRVTLKPDGSVAEQYILFAAAEPEIGCILVEPDGTLYVGTADADQARPTQAMGAGDMGRPDGANPMKPNGPVPTDPTDPGGDDPGAGEPGSSTGTKEPGAMKNNILPNAMASALPTGRPAMTPLNISSLDSTPTDDASKDNADGPSADQRDQLRAVIRQRLEQARKSGAVAPGALAGPGAPGKRPTRHQIPSPVQAGAGRPGGAPPGAGGPHEGNAIYKISPMGLASEIFRDTSMMLKIVKDSQGRLVVATGNEGHIFQIDLVGGERTIIADLIPSQVLSMLPEADGSLILGTSNPATLVKLSNGYAKTGNFTSTVFDGSQISLWGKIVLTLTLPTDTGMTVQTRSGNVPDPDKGPWSAWSDAQVIKPDNAADPGAPQAFQINSPPARFLQYRVTMTSNEKATPVLITIDMAYIVPNLKPVLAAVKASYPDAAQHVPGMPSMPPQRALRMPQVPGAAAGQGDDAEPSPVMTIEWEASDPNNDRLKANVEYQRIGTNVWVNIAKDVDGNSLDWQTKKVADGRYLIRVTVSDAPDNTPEMTLTDTRITEQVVVNNTPPVFTNLKSLLNKQVATIMGTCASKLSLIRNIQYCVDSGDQWLPVLPNDMIYDSTSEAFTITIRGLSPGQHVVTLRGIDARSNSKYESLTVDVK